MTKEKLFKNDEEIKYFNHHEEFIKFLERKQCEELWIEPYVNELSVVGIGKEPLFIEEHKTKNNMVNDNDAILECMNNTGLFLSLPVENKRITYPIRQMGVNSVFGRAQLTGATMRNTEKKPKANPLAPSVKAEWLTTACELYSSPCKVLLSDNKITVAVSDRYTIVSEIELYREMELCLKTLYDEVNFIEGKISHECCTFSFKVKDDTLTNKFAQKLAENNVLVNNIEAKILVSTSNMGNSAMRVFPIILLDDSIEMRCGKPIEMDHKGEKNTATAFREKVNNLLLSLFRDSANEIAELSKITIKNPLGLYDKIIEDFNLPLDSAAIVRKNFEAEMWGDVTALDVYWYISQIPQVTKSTKEMSLNTYLNLQEDCARTISVFKYYLF